MKNRMFERVAAVALCLGCATPALADSVTFDAFSVWAADGTTIETQPGTLTFAGTLSGPYFVDTGKGPMPGGLMSCVGTLVSDTKEAKQSGKADCVLEATDGARAFARLECSGLPLIGCEGPFEIFAGEGRLKGVTGSGTIVFRRMGTQLSPGEIAGVRHEAAGIAFWKGFTLNVPASQ